MDKKANWKSLAKDFTDKEVIDSLFGGFIFASLLYLPLLIVLIEMVTVYMYRLVFLSLVIIVSLFIYVYLIHFFWKKSLRLKKSDINTDINKLFMKNMIIVNSIILVLGLFFIIVLIPILWV